MSDLLNQIYEEYYAFCAETGLIPDTVSLTQETIVQLKDELTALNLPCFPTSQKNFTVCGMNVKVTDLSGIHLSGNRRKKECKECGQ